MTTTAFSSYKFQLSGCKFILDKLIELPLISVRYGYSSAERLASILNKLLKDYDNHRTTQNYENAVRQAEAHQAGEFRLSHKLWRAQIDYAQGEKLSRMVKDGDVEYSQLDEEQQQMVLDFDSEASKRKLDKALEEKASKRPCYRGAGAETQTAD